MKSLYADPTSLVYSGSRPAPRRSLFGKLAQLIGVGTPRSGWAW